MEQLKYLNEKQVSDMIGRALQTLRNDRFMRRGIPYIKVGRSVRYNYADVVHFMESRKIGTEDLVGAAPPRAKDCHNERRCK